MQKDSKLFCYMVVFCFLGCAGEMRERKCDFECDYLDDSGECEAVGTDCIGDLCECRMCCQNCTRSDDCENVAM